MAVAPTACRDAGVRSSRRCRLLPQPGRLALFQTSSTTASRCGAVTSQTSRRSCRHGLSLVKPAGRPGAFRHKVRASSRRFGGAPAAGEGGRAMRATSKSAAGAKVAEGGSAKPVRDGSPQSPIQQTPRRAAVNSSAVRRRPLASVTGTTTVCAAGQGETPGAPRDARASCPRRAQLPAPIARASAPGAWACRA